MHSESGEAAYLIYNAQVTPAPRLKGVTRMVRPSVAHALALKAAAAGALPRTVKTRHGLAIQGYTEWDVSGSCQNPQRIEVWARAFPFEIERGYRPIRVIIMDTKCRKCENCQRARSALWRGRALDEMSRSHRTWFCTFTLNPDAYYRMTCLAAVKASAKGVELGDRPGDENRRVLIEGFIELTKWLKRLRKNTGAKVRYLLVNEWHKSGVPHWHMLLHETSGSPIKWRDLDGLWVHGFTTFKLAADKRAAIYIAKYIAKDAQASVRASLGYGRPKGPVPSEAKTVESLRLCETSESENVGSLGR